MLHWLASYRKEWLRCDLIAGLTAAAVVVPQAMAYAVIAGLPLTTGLYTAMVPLVVYAIMGTSRPLSVTTTSTLAILTANAVHGVAGQGGEAALMSATAALCLVVGGALILAWILRLGAVANLISEPVLIGFKAGVGVVIIVDQLPKLMGVHIAKAGFLHNVLAIVASFPKASGVTVAVALAMLALQLGLQRFFPRVPASLVTVAAGISAAAFGLEQMGVALVGEVKGGLPAFAMPDLNLSLAEHLWPAAVGIALMSFVETVAAGRAFRGPDEPRPDANRELLALGLTNIVCGLFQAMPSGGGTSQTAVNSGAGARSQVAGLVSAAVVVAVLFFLAPLIGRMPQATLATVVVVSCAGMIHTQEFRAIRRIRSMEFRWAMASLIGVMVLGTLKGIVAAVTLSVLSLAYQSNRRPVYSLGRKPGTEIFRPLSAEHPQDEIFPGLLIVKPEGAIHFANAQRVGDLIWPFVHENQPRVLAVDCSAIVDFEYTALKMLAESELQLRRSGIRLWLAALNPEPLQMVLKTPLGEALGREGLFFNLEQVVRAYQSLDSDTPPQDPLGFAEPRS